MKTQQGTNASILGLAVNLALTAPQSVSQLEENLSVLNAPQLSPQEVQQWQLYGALIYGTGQDAFDTQWI